MQRVCGQLFLIKLFIKFKDHVVMDQIVNKVTAVMTFPSCALTAKSRSSSLSWRDRNFSRDTTWNIHSANTHWYYTLILHTDTTDMTDRQVSYLSLLHSLDRLLRWPITDIILTSKQDDREKTSYNQFDCNQIINQSVIRLLVFLLYIQIWVFGVLERRAWQTSRWALNHKNISISL